MQEQINMKEYTIDIPFHLGSSKLQLRKNQDVKFDGRYLLLNDKKFDVPLFAAAIKENWAIPKNKSESIENNIIENISADNHDEHNISIDIDLSRYATDDPDNFYDEDYHKKEDIDDKNTYVIDSENFKWDTTLHWKVKINLLDQLNKDQLNSIKLVEKGKVIERINELLQE